MSYSNRMWAAANSLSDQGQKIKALSYGKHQFFSALVSSGIGGLLGGEREQKEDSLRQVMYLNCWGQG